MIGPGSAITVLGAGNMGSGIAQACAQAGFSVRVRDVDDGMLERGRGLIGKTLEGGIQRKKLTPARRDEILSRIIWTRDVGEAVRGAALVIEAVYEEESVKRPLFREVGELAPAEAIVATNTSSLSVTGLSEGFPGPHRFAGLHFFFPAAINKLLEVIGGERTDPATLAELERFGYRLKKVPIRVKDSAGFAVNRYFVPYLNESARLAEEHVASLATIEEVGRTTFGTTLGPFELMNVTGIPIAYHSEGSLAAAFGSPYTPSALLKSQFESGGPWPWKDTAVEPDRKPAVRERLLGLVFGIAAELVEEGVASAEATDRGARVGLRWPKGPFELLNEVGLSVADRLVAQFADPWKGAFPVAPTLTRLAKGGSVAWPLSNVRVERRGAVDWVLLDRPEVLNSLNSGVLADLDHAFEGLERDPSVRCVVLSGSSPVFAAGADIAEMERKDLPEGRAFGFSGQAVCKRIEEFRTPVIAFVEGYALGGGLEIALACDFIVAADGAKLGLPEATVGIHPGFGGASRLTRLIGRARTKLLVYSAEAVDASEALRMGFVARTLPKETAVEEVQMLASTIASRAPLAIAWVKAVINRGADSSLDASLRLEGESAGHTFATADRTEGMRAFLERRPAKFQGR
ncbi:MAG: enoyl-CoA hydratase-related protein [Thermoplasmata archaeon]|nr:enoyl-CoA hydratase-related protein [Thermoplasmata archaeon]MCI4358975.1 enoyl-CoA hydratase-related protein [Thermoplasmata archaeon]